MRSTQVSGLLTDLYQFTMLQGYLESHMDEVAVYEFFVRKLPPRRNFLVAAGLESVLDYLLTVRFAPDEIRFLEKTGRFNRRFLDYLENFSFSGDVYAMPEGRVFFPDEPILRITAPILEAQLIETRIINLLHYQTLVASKAARVVLAAPNRLLVDFGLRRAHGAEAALLGARAAFIAGFHGSSNVLAEHLFGIPSYGTMAHSFIQAHDDEAAAFEHFAHAQPGNVVLLIDTYDTEAAAEKVVRLAPRLKAAGIAIRAVRIDSGDLADHAKKVRRILDAGGLKDTGIFASGNLDEYEIQRLLAQDAPITGFGVGTRMLTSSDAPYLDCAYKLMEYAGHARRKRSEGKATWPGRKQVYRTYDGEGRMAGDTLCLDSEGYTGEPLLQMVMKEGKRTAHLPGLAEARKLCAQDLLRLPEALKSLDGAPPYPVTVSRGLKEMAAAVDEHRA
ncbi:nicotinate phosphoribosyltransferase [Thiobacter aerophilum]|uniref:Nicotinate phosphoribosyltransferase n=1 Tax=Thiobacter aerophilum TaxID=3121275 RepID=A0ABV0ECF4_9BURK